MSVEHIVHIDMAGYTREKAVRFIGACGLAVEERAVYNAAVDEGQLKASISSRHKGLTAIVAASAGHAPWVEYGTGPHMINAPVYIKKAGGWRFIRMHPGTKEQPFMRPAVDEVRTILPQIWSAV